MLEAWQNIAETDVFRVLEPVQAVGLSGFK